MKGLATTCKHCKKSFVRKKNSQIYCSTACRVKAYRERHGLSEPDWDGMKRRSLGDQITTRTKQMALELYELEQWYNGIQTALHEFHNIGTYINDTLQPNSKESWTVFYSQNSDIVEFREFTTNHVAKLPIRKLKMFRLNLLHKFFEGFAFRKHTPITNIQNEWSVLVKDIMAQSEKFKNDYIVAKRHIESCLGAITGKPIHNIPNDTKGLLLPKSKGLADGITVTTGRQLSQLQATPRLQLNSPFDVLLGDSLPLAFYGLIWGNSGTGKSTFALRLLKELSRFGNVAFFNAETEVSRDSPIYRLVQQTRADDIPLISGSTVEQLELVLQQDLYQFIVIDSISRLELTPQRVQQLRMLAPNRTIIGLMESNKDGSMFKGSNEWKHHANIMIKSERIAKNGRNYARYTVEKNQYGNINNFIDLSI